MIRYVVKNNIKLMFRSKWIIILLIIAPILTIAILSSAFKTLLKSYESVSEFSVGYTMESGSIFEAAEDLVKETGKESGIKFVRYQEGNPKELIETNGLSCYIEFGQDDYTIYESKDFTVEGITMEYFLSKVMDEYRSQALCMLGAAETGTVSNGANQKENPQPDSTQSDDMQQNTQSSELPVMKISYMPAINASDYYGIVYIVYFGCCGIVCAAGILSNEKKYGIRRKFLVSPLSEWKLYLCRLLPVVITMTLGMFLTTFLTILMFGIHWGNLLLSGLLVFLVVLSGTAFGYMIYYWCQNVAITVVVLFTVTWFMAYFGGSFETYMYSSVSDVLKNLSPIYHANRALTEISCMGHSTYTFSCIVYLLGITTVCSGVALFTEAVRKRGKS